MPKSHGHKGNPNQDLKPPEDAKTPKDRREKQPAPGGVLLQKRPQAGDLLPTIGLSSGPNIIEIRNQITTYCQQRQIGKIARCLATGAYEEKEVITIDNALLGDAADPHGMQKELYLEERKAINEEFRSYVNSKEQLLGILKSMTDKPLDEKITARYQSLQVEFSTNLAVLQTSGPTADVVAKFLSDNTVNLLCPLLFWKNIVFLCTAKNSGNRRLDQDTAMRTLSNMRQRGNESLNDYLCRFNNAKDAYILLDIPLPSEESMATGYIQGLDQSRYSEYLTYLGNELSIGGRDMFPTTLAAAISTTAKWLTPSTKGPREVSQHSAYGGIKGNPKALGKEKGKEKDKKQEPKDTSERPTCTYCGKVGHKILSCFKLIADQAAAKSNGDLDKKKATAAAAVSRTEEPLEEPTGFGLSSFPHITRPSKSTTMVPIRGAYTACPTLRQKLYITSPTTLHAVEDRSVAVEDLPYRRSLTPTLDKHSALANGGADSLSELQLIFDSGANATLIKNKELLSNIHQVSPTTFDGLSGTLTVTTSGDLLGICEAYFHADAVANIVSLSQLRDLGHDVSYNCSTDEFILSYRHGVCSFSRRENGLYVCDVPASATRTAMVTTVSDNESHYSIRDVKRARSARDLQRRLGNPTDTVLGKLLSNGYIIDPTVLPGDVLRATAIYGPNVEGLKGRTTKKKAVPIPTATLSRRMSEPQTMSIDIFYANGLAFLISFVQPIGHTATTQLVKTDVPTLRQAIRRHLGLYGQKGVRIKEIHSDNEKGVTAMAADFSANGIALVQCGPGMHIPTIERRIRHIKEMTRGVLAGLPYHCSQKLLAYLVTFVTGRSNMFPSSTLPHGDSPFRLMEGRTPNHLDMSMEFGALYQIASRTMDNSMAPRTTASIGIAQVLNGTGTCRFLNLKSLQVLTANHFTHVPMNQDAINILNALALKDGRLPTKDPVFQYHGAHLIGDSPPDDTDHLLGPADPLPPLIDIPQDGDPDPEPVPPPPVAQRAESHREQPAHVDIRGDAGADDPDYTDNDPDDPDMPGLLSDSDDESDDDSDDDDDDEEPPNLPLDVPTSPTTVHAVEDRPVAVKDLPNRRPPAPYNHPTRTRRSPDRLNLMAATNESDPRSIALNMTVKRAMIENKTETEPAIQLELSNLTQKAVFRGRHYQDLTPSQRSNIIPSHMNITVKVAPTSDGTGRTRDKVKARLVGGGDRQDRNHYTRSETSAPTCSITGTLARIALAQAEEEEVVVTDISCAYLNARMPKSDPNKIVIMRINSHITSMLITTDPSMSEFVGKDGSLLVELDRALYGCVESARLWYDELSNTLINEGFTPNDCDPCIFNKTVGGTQITIIVYVDDLMIISKKPRLIKAIITTLEMKYDKLKISSGKVHNYLGMVFDFSNPTYVSVDQIGMVEDIISSTRTAVQQYTATPLSAAHRSFAERLKKAPSASSKTPAAPYLFAVSTDSPLLEDELKAIFHSTVAKLMFISNRTRQDILTTLSFLTGRVRFPTEEDWQKLARVLQYLGATKEDKLLIGCTRPYQVHASIDSSFAVHPTGRSHTGVTVTLGRGVLYSKSTAQKINTTSSCQAEMVALAKGLQQGIFLAYFLAGQGYPQLPVLVSQDNQSTIKLVENGRSSSELTRHIEIGYFWTKDLVDRGLIDIVYCPTGDMIADFFTKPLQSTLFSYLKGKVMGISPIA